MKNSVVLPLLLSLCIFFAGCEPDLVEPATDTATASAELAATRSDQAPCPEYFYYYGTQKVQLGNALGSRVVVGFADGYTTAQKQAVLQKYAFFKAIETEYHTGSADATVVLLQDNSTCADAEAAMKALVQEVGVRYANPVFPQTLGDGYLGITNQFIVTLKSQFRRSDLDQLARKTNTTIVDQLGDYTYILSADKNSTGNALASANYFAEHNKMESGEPDFLYLPGAGTSSNF